MIRGQNLPAITQIADSDVLIVDSASGGTRKITYAQLCQAVKQTLGIREVIDSVNITEDGYLMGGKVIADALAQLNSKFILSNDITSIQFQNIAYGDDERLIFFAYINDANFYRIDIRIGINQGIQVRKITNGETTVDFELFP